MSVLYRVGLDPFPEGLGEPFSGTSPTEEVRLTGMVVSFSDMGDSFCGYGLASVLKNGNKLRGHNDDPGQIIQMSC
jgi:hypothetical protein